MNSVTAFEAAACAVQLCHAVGLRFRLGVTRAAADAVVGLSGEDAVEAMDRVFCAYALPRHIWDGSIA